MTIDIHHDPYRDHWIVACTDHGILWDCPGKRDAHDYADTHRLRHQIHEHA